MPRKILCYKVEISDGSGILPKENAFVTKTYTVIGENERYLVIDDVEFTTIEKGESSYNVYASLNRESIWTNTEDSVFGNRISYTLYTESEVSAKTIREQIEVYIQKKYGFFVQGLDLSIIKDTV